MIPLSFGGSDRAGLVRVCVEEIVEEHLDLTVF